MITYLLFIVGVFFLIERMCMVIYAVNYDIRKLWFEYNRILGFGEILSSLSLSCLLLMQMF